MDKKKFLNAEIFVVYLNPEDIILTSIKKIEDGYVEKGDGDYEEF